MVKTCQLTECQEEFETKQPAAKYCCSRHQQRAAWRRHQGAVAEEVRCKLESCENTFLKIDGRKKYCSRSCAATANNIIRSHGKPKRFCWCGLELSWWQKVACSQQHGAQRRTNEYIERWLRGEESGSKPSGAISTMVRNYLVEQADYHCQSPTCAVPGGWSVPNPVTGKPILTVDHIDGNWKNNAVDNLIVLCYSCHTLTPTFGALNVGSESGSRPYIEARKRQ